MLTFVTAQICWRPCHTVESFNCIKQHFHIPVCGKPVCCVSWIACTGGVGVMELWRAAHFNLLVHNPQRLHRSACCHPYKVHENFTFLEQVIKPIDVRLLCGQQGEGLEVLIHKDDLLNSPACSVWSCCGLKLSAKQQRDVCGLVNKFNTNIPDVSWHCNQENILRTPENCVQMCASAGLLLPADERKRHDSMTW